MAQQGKATGSKARITKRAIDDLRGRAKSEGRTLYLRDDELTGFGSVSTKTGTCSYFVEYRLGGRETTQKRMTIGKHGVLTPDEARKLARKKLGDLASGQDVAQAKKDARRKLTGTTLKEVMERYLASKREPGRYWLHKRGRLLGKDMERLHNRPIATIKRSDLTAVIDEVKMRGKTEAAARLLFVDLRPFFKWALERELIEANPMFGMTPPAAAEKRERVLAEYEIRAFWQAASEMSWPFASIYKLLLLTGTRREEVAAIRWGELCLDSGVWTLPSAKDFSFKRKRCDGVELIENRTKNKREHCIPLPTQAVSLLDKHAILALKSGLGYEDSDLVFSKNGINPPSGFSKAKRALDARMKAILGSRFKEWHVHDLRRTCATGMENLSVETRVTEAALNHVSGVKAGIVGTYQTSKHVDAVATAFQAWGDKIMQIVSTEKVASNVVAMRTLRIGSTFPVL